MANTLITALVSLLVDIGAWIYGGVIYSNKTEAFQKIYVISYIAGFIGLISLVIMSLLIKYKDRVDAHNAIKF